MNEHPIFLVGAHKSGTSLLRSILDGHPELFTIPFESHYFQNMHYWVDCNYRMERPKQLTKQEIIQRFTARLEHLNQAEDAIGDVPQNFRINLPAFNKIFQDVSPEMEERQRFELYMNALHYALHQVPLPADKRVVEKSVEHAEFAGLLHKMFPKARFVHIVRNPYANAVSLRKYKNIQARFPLIFRLLQTLYNNFYYLYSNSRLLDHYFIIRFEDLLRQPEKEIIKLADFLNLSFTDSLLQPTKFGSQWSGNSSEQVELNSIDAGRIDAWKKEISPMEIRFINKLFPFVLDDFAYERLPDPSLPSFLRPLAGEGVLRYIVNRMYLGYLSYKPGFEI